MKACEVCGKELIGKQRTFCSDKCRMQAKRQDKASQDAPGSPNPNEPEHEQPEQIEPEQTQPEQPVEPDSIALQAVRQVCFNHTLQDLSPAPTRPTGYPTPATADMAAEQLRRAVSGYHGLDWIGSPEYAETIYRLLTKTIDELKADGQTIPAWKLMQEAA